MKMTLKNLSEGCFFHYENDDKLYKKCRQDRDLTEWLRSKNEHSLIILDIVNDELVLAIGEAEVIVKTL